MSHAHQYSTILTEKLFDPNYSLYESTDLTQQFEKHVRDEISKTELEDHQDLNLFETQINNSTLKSETSQKKKFFLESENLVLKEKEKEKEKENENKKEKQKGKGKENNMAFGNTNYFGISSESDIDPDFENFLKNETKRLEEQEKKNNFKLKEGHTKNSQKQNTKTKDSLNLINNFHNFSEESDQSEESFELDFQNLNIKDEQIEIEIEIENESGNEKVVDIGGGSNKIEKEKKSEGEESQEDSQDSGEEENKEKENQNFQETKNIKFSENELFNNDEEFSNYSENETQSEFEEDLKKNSKPNKGTTTATTTNTRTKKKIKEQYFEFGKIKDRLFQKLENHFNPKYFIIILVFLFLYWVIIQLITLFEQMSLH
ncbi:hypothetical protein M0813_28224 [Anaeramoeba flamelloides]|uniref:Transmembrane protein n=1 Tax=Anaeramoeba flamelloides TaxID=1746091 RepID=A0ABQ8XUC7_9EUKA|nr:hypothetical protein M0813_28224 [Anaeramoeba flamelloides]